MRRAWLGLIAAALLAMVGGCASRSPGKISIPPAIRNGSLVITSGIRVVSSTSLPEGFETDPDYAPIWIRHGTEIAIAGMAGGKRVLLSVAGPEGLQQRVIAEDLGPAEQDRILDIAASADGLTLAIAVAEPQENRVEVLLRDALSDSVARSASSFDGASAWAQLKWLDGATLALARRSESGVDDNAADVTSLDLITVAGSLETKPLEQIKCALSPLSFSPDARLAVAQGDIKAPPALLDLHAETCRTLTIGEPVRVLAWAPDASAFLYSAHGKNGVPGVFCYDLASGRSVIVAISSGAAAYASDGTIVAAGNTELSLRRAADASSKPIVVEIASITPYHGVITVNALGLTTLPAMLARSSMMFSRNTDCGVMDIAIPAPAGPLRELIEYSYPTRAAFILASGPADAPLALSWSPDGKLLALVDAGVQPNRVTVLAPPR
jgi:hypothetical protein